MEITVLCNCEDCSSTLIKVGYVNVLLDIPSRLLVEYSETLKGSLVCQPNSNCDLFDKFRCSRINLILITNSRGFEGLELLNNFFDLSNTHIICTRPVYVLSIIFYQNQNLNGFNSVNNLKGFRNNRLISNVKEEKFGNQLSLLDFLSNNNLLHTIAYNEMVKVRVTVSGKSFSFNKETNFNKKKQVIEENTNLNKNENLNKNNNLGDFNVLLEIIGLSSGYSMGSCNYIIKHENIKERLVYISGSSNFKRYTKPFDLSIFQNLNLEDIVILGPNSYSYNGLMDSKGVIDNLEINSGNELQVKSLFNSEPFEIERGNFFKKGKMDGFERDEFIKNAEFKETVKMQRFDKNTELFGQKEEKRSFSDKEKENGKVYQVMDNLASYCVDNVINGKSVIIPLDFNYEYLLDILECLGRSFKNSGQSYIYIVGKGVEDLFSFLEKCCEWVREDLSEFSMDSENPKSPFPDLEEMKNNNQLFFSDTLKELRGLYRIPSVLVLLLREVRDLLGYVNNKNTNFLLLQNKFLSCFGIGQSGSIISSSSSDSSNTDKPGLSGTYSCDNNSSDGVSSIFLSESNSSSGSVSSLNGDKDTFNSYGKSSVNGILNVDKDVSVTTYSDVKDGLNVSSSTDKTSDKPMINLIISDYSVDKSKINEVKINNPGEYSTFTTLEGGDCLSYNLDLRTRSFEFDFVGKVLDLTKLGIDVNLKVELKEEGLGYVRGKINSKTLEDLKFKQVDGGLSMNKFRVTLEDINDVDLSVIESGISSEKEFLEQDEQLFLFGNYDFDRLYSELKKFFPNTKIEIIKRDNVIEGLNSLRIGIDCLKREVDGLKKEVKEDLKMDIDEEGMESEDSKKSYGKKGEKSLKKSKNLSKKTVESSLKGDEPSKKNVESKVKGVESKSKGVKSFVKGVEGVTKSEVNPTIKGVNPSKSSSNSSRKGIETLTKSEDSTMKIKQLCKEGKKEEEINLIVLKSNLFTLVVNLQENTTIIETVNDNYRKYIMKSIQNTLVTL